MYQRFIDYLAASINIPMMVLVVMYWIDRLTATMAEVRLISQIDYAMSRLTFICNVGHRVQSKKLTDVEKFAQVLSHLNHEFELPPKAWTVGEQVLKALKTRERSIRFIPTSVVPRMCGES